MPEPLARLILVVIGTYAGLGCVFAPLFVWKGAAKIDPVAAKGSWGFRWIIMPGAALFWPLLLLRWLRGQGTPVERSPHRDGRNASTAIPENLS